MYQAIKTVFFGPTNHREPRVKATADAGTITVNWDDSIGVEANHLLAARKLCKKLDWNCDLIGGMLPIVDDSYVFVITRFNRE